MKKLYFFLLLTIGLLIAGCSANTYSSLRGQEDGLIGDFIQRNKLNIIYELPEDDAWGEKDYYKVPKGNYGNYDDLYFHLIQRGESEREIAYNDVVVTRYKKFQLEEGADTISYWTTNDEPAPYEFIYGPVSGTGKICESKGWQEAIRLMKYPGSQCEMIVPSKQGFYEDEMSVTPYVYIIKIVQVK
jgi:hypothetical protein